MYRGCSHFCSPLEDSLAHAQKMGGELLGLDEARAFLDKNGPIYPGEDQWAAVIRAGGVRDWVQVGNKIHHTGKSHRDEQGGYPSWGDNASGNPTWSRSVLWLPGKSGAWQLRSHCFGSSCSEAHAAMNKVDFELVHNTTYGPVRWVVLSYRLFKWCSKQGCLVHTCQTLPWVRGSSQVVCMDCRLSF